MCCFNFINLDLIKKVSSVKAYVANRNEYEDGKILYYFDIDSFEIETRYLIHTTNGTEEQKKDIVI